MDNNFSEEVIVMKKYQCVMQDGIKDCGVSSLLTIVRSYDGDIPREYLRILTNTTQDGVNAFSLLEAGRKLGFDTKGVNGSFVDINDKFLPCIAHVIIDSKYKHFLVIHKINRKNKYVILADPDKGIIKMSFDDFSKITTGNFLFFTPNKKIPFIKLDNKVKNKIFEFIYENRSVLLTIIFFSLLYTFINIITSFNFQFIIDKALSYNSKFNLYFIFIILFILYILKDIAEFLRSRLLNFISHKLDYILVANSFSHILLLPHLYYKNRTTGEIISRVNDLSEIRDSISHLIVTFLVDFILLIFVLCFMFSISTTLSLVVVLIIAIYIIITLLFNKLMYPKVRDIKEKESIVNSYMIELINGVDSVRGMNVFDTIIDRFNIKYNNYLNCSYHFSLISNIQKLVADILTSIMILIIILIGSILVMENYISLGELITYNSLIYYFLEPIKNIVNFDIIFKRIKIIIDRINEILSIENEQLFLDSNKIEALTGDISINNLSYSYNNRDFLFKNLFLNIRKGEKIVISGESGSGKSTLAKIIARYIPVERNLVFIGDKDINDCNLFSLRENITYVSQNEFIFTDTIYNNINLNNTHDYDDVSSVCKCTLVDAITKDRLSNYNMLLEENGMNLSGGERQRIILARTFLKNSNVYILDESFSEIDAENERIIITNLFEKFSDKTIIVISHRNDNNDLYDRVIDIGDFIYGN